jgi:hypothetical protein
MWKAIVQGKPLTRLLLLLAIIAVQIVTLPLVQVAPPLHAIIFIVCLLFFVSFVI